jgi:ABC-type amino acid transport substrate-binding protein
MSKSPFIFLAAIAFLAGLAGAFVLPKVVGGKDVSAPAKETTYDRVMRTQTIRCGYVVWTPFLVKDPNSGKLSGLFYDYTEALGEALHLKIEWTEEEGWGDFPAALNGGRIDAMCGGSWANSTRAREIDFVHPIIYQQTYAWVRAGDTRFDNNLDAINNPAISVVFVEGSTQAVIAAHDFPKAKPVPLPELTSLADTLVSLADGKADVGLVSAEAGYQYTLNNPGKVRRVEAKMPLRIFGNSLAVPGGEERLRRMLDNATNELLASGQIEKMIGDYGKVTETWLRVAQPYQTETH